jgi:hypothetical protein
MVAATAVAADPVPLSSEAIKETLSGSLVELDTPAGSTIPVRFQEDGLVSGEAGPLASVLGSEKDRGRWWTADDQLCVKWFRWFDAEVRCASLRQDGTRIFWQERGGESGTATIAELAKPAAKPTPPPYALGAEQVAKEETDKDQVSKSETVATSAETPAPAQNVGQHQVADGPADSADPPPLKFAGIALGTTQGVTPEAHAPGSSFDPRRLSPVHKESVKVAAETTEPPAKEMSPPAPSAAPVVTRAAPAPPPVRTAAPAKPSPPPSLMSFRVAGVAEDDMLNVRSGPSEYHSRVGVIPPASRGVKIVGPCRDAWCPIQHGRVSGWVNRYYLAVESYGASPGFQDFEAGAERQRVR